MPEQVGGGFRCDIVFAAPVGRVRKVLSRVLGDPRRAPRGSYYSRERALYALWDASQVETLLAFKQDAMAIETIEAAHREGKFGRDGLMGELLLDVPLFDREEGTTTVPGMLSRALDRMATARGRGRGTAYARYTGDLAKLEAHLVPAFLTRTACVRDLPAVNWPDVLHAWPHSADYWMNVRTALTRALSVHFGDPFHPWRRALVKAIPRRARVKREPDWTPELFWQAVARVPEYLQAAYVLLAITGLRIGEYEQLGPEHLRPGKHAIRVPGTKTDDARAHLFIDTPDDDPHYWWRWVTSAVHTKACRNTLGKHWRTASAAVGLGEDSWRLHDIRHVTGQSADEGGATLSQIQKLLRHATPEMSMRYVSRKDKGAAARAVGSVLRPAQ